MEKLAIVCSYDINCGNASYTQALYEEFGRKVPTEVVSLDPILYRGGRGLEKRGNEFIEDLAKKLKEYTYVNIQFEAGLYGQRCPLIAKRLEILVRGCNNVVITFHRIDPPKPARLVNVVKLILKAKLLKAFRYARDENKSGRMFTSIFSSLKEESKNRKISVMVHTPREKNCVERVYGFKSVYCHPLTFLTQEKRDRFIQKKSAVSLHDLTGIAPDGKIVGMFGYISPYKGYETAIRAAALLPDDYYLCMFGSQHPMTITEDCPVDPYLKRLLDLISGLETERRMDPTRKRPLNDRIRFLGTLDDDGFIFGLAACDVVVVPYLEVNQGMSGISALALEVKSNVIFSHNLAFNELDRYCPGAFEKFDMGNHVQLYQKILGYKNRFDEKLEAYYRKYNVLNNIDYHLRIFRGQV